MNLSSCFRRGAVALLASPLMILAQGALAPEGAPAPTMRTLEQLDRQLDNVQARSEARVPLSPATTPGSATSTFIITEPGSYYLAGGVAVPDGGAGVTIAASNVSLDLNGFRIAGGGTTGTGVAFSGPRLSAVAIGGGAITGCQTGVAAGTTELVGVRLHDLRLIGNSGAGIVAATASSSTILAERVLVSGGASYGIYLPSTGSAAINCAVADLSGSSVVGIQAEIVQGCSVRNLSATGYQAGVYAEQVRDCVVEDMTGTGSGSGAWFAFQAGSMHDCTARRLKFSGSAAWAFFSNSYCGVVDGCRVETVEYSGAWFVGLQGGVVRDCQISGVTISGANSNGCGVAATNAENLVVQSFTVDGFAFIGINAQQVVRCQVGGLAGTAGRIVGITGNSVERCLIRNVRNIGIEVMATGDGSGGATVTGNTVIGIGETAGVTGAMGIAVGRNHCRVEGNQVVAQTTNSTCGIHVSGTQNLIIGNRCSGKFGNGAATAAFNIGAGNRFGTVVTSYGADGEITTANPWANFAELVAVQ